MLRTGDGLKVVVPIGVGALKKGSYIAGIKGVIYSHFRTACMPLLT